MRGFPGLLLFLLLIPAAFPDLGSQDISFDAYMDVAAVSNLQVTGFSASPQNPVAGESVTFYVTVYSVGNVVTDFQPAVYIYDSGGALVDSFNYSNSTIAGGEQQTLSTSWSTAGLAAGDYTVYVNASYNGTTTGTLSVSLSVSSPAPPTPGGGGAYKPAPGIIIPILPKPPNVTLPLVGPAIENLKVLRLSPYREMLPGENAIISPMVENPTDSLVSFNLSLAGSGAWFASPVQNVLLSPGEKMTVPMTIRIPANMPRGYYAFYVNVSSGGSEISYPAVIRVVHSYKIGEPIVKRQLSLDYEKNETLVTLTLTNTGPAPLQYVQIYDRVPDPLMYEADNIIFTSKPAKITGDARFGTAVGTVRWDMERLLPYESRTIYYRMPLLLNDMNMYSGWNLAQLVTIENAAPSEIQVRDLRSPSMMPGEEGAITLKLFNGGSLGREVEVDVLSPNGWKVAPHSVTLNIPARESQQMDVLVESPKFADAGTYGFTLRIKSGDAIIDKQVFVYIYTPIVEVYAPPITDQLSAWVGGNALSAIVVLFVVVVVGAGLAVAYRYSRMPRYSRERVNSLKVMEELFNQPDRKRGRAAPPKIPKGLRGV